MTEMETKDQFDLFLNCLTDGVVFINASGTVVFANLSVMQMLGRSRQQLIGLDIHDAFLLQRDQVLLEGDRAPFRAVLDGGPLFNSDQDREAQYQIARHDRSVFSVQIFVLPFHYDQTEGALIIIHDKSNDEKIEAAKSEFVALVSHQLRTPVSIISWYVEKLMHQRKGSLNNRQLDYLKEVYRSNRRIIDLVQSVINVSRTDLSKLKHKHEVVEVKPIVEKLLRDNSELIEEHTLEISTKLTSITLHDSDAELIQVVCKNILLNALHYTEDGGKVSIHVDEISEGATLDADVNLIAKSAGALITITDTGVGIPDEEKNRIFNKLYRGSNVQTLDVNGLGLGLYIAEAFTQVLGGHIWFESELRMGSTFYIYFPDH